MDKVSAVKRWQRALNSDVGDPNVRCIHSIRLLLLLVMFKASPGALAQSAADMVTAYIEGDSTAVIIFLPPSARESRDQGAAAAREHVKSALKDIKLCLGEDDVSYQVVFAQRIVVRATGGEDTFEVGHFAPLVGALLLRPGRNARIVFAGGGPEALAQMLRSAASRYFDKRCKAG